jgi:hypothetical protein
MAALSFSDTLLVETKNGNLHAVQKLIAKNPEVRVSVHALYDATKNNKPDLVAELLKITDQSKYENLVLNLAIEKGYMECIELLFEHSHFSSYSSALECAVKYNQPEILQWMLERGLFSKRTIAEGMAEMKTYRPHEGVFKVLYAHGGRDAFNQLLEIKGVHMPGMGHLGIIICNLNIGLMRLMV